MGYTTEQFRLSPNVFDLVATENLIEEQTDTNNQYDVYLSYNQLDSPSYLLANSDNQDLSLPPSYRNTILQDIVDPRDIVRNLEHLNCKVAYDEEKTAVDQIFKKINSSKGGIPMPSN